MYVYLQRAFQHLLGPSKYLSTSPTFLSPFSRDAATRTGLEEAHPREPPCYREIMPRSKRGRVGEPLGWNGLDWTAQSSQVGGWSLCVTEPLRPGAETDRQTGQC